MSTRTRTRTIVEPKAAETGVEAIDEGMAQSLTLDDVQAVLFSTFPLEQRRAQLMSMRNEIRARRSVDLGGDMAAILAEIERAIAQLDRPYSYMGSRERFGMVPEDRLDTAAPGERDR